MTPEQHYELIELINADGYCGMVVRGCADCVLGVLESFPEITRCGVPRHSTAIEAFSLIKSKAIERLIEEGYQDDVIGLLL